MPKKTIFRGSVANDGTGDNLRFGAEKVNDNFTELYTLLGDGSTLSAGTIVTTTESQTITNKSIDGSNNTITNIPSSALSPIANAQLVNSTISIGGITFNLGDTDATPALDLADATNYPTTSLSGTITNAQLAGSISNDKLLNNTITIGDDTSTNFNVNLGDSFEIVGGSGVNTAIENNRITISTDGSIVTETSSDTLTNKTINGPDNTLTNIANGSLANSSVTLGSDVVNLGDTKTSIAGLSLTGSGTIDLTGAGSKARFDFAGFGSLPAFGTYPGMFAFDTVGNRPYYSSGSGWVRILDENASVSAHTDVNLTGIADGYILQWSSGDGRFNVVANSSSGIASLAADTTPQLGGDLDAQGKYVQDVGYFSHRSPDATVTQSLAVTVITKTTEHTSYGQGSSLGYAIDGHEGSHLQLSRGVYKFDLENSSSSHPFRLYEDEDKNIAYTTGVTTSGSGGSSGDHLTITIDDDTPTPLFYQCSAHGNMGGRIDILGGKRRRLNITTDKTNSGDGSTTAFTCLANRSVDDILVFVNGICLVPTDDYSVSGTTLTFTVAPSASAEIVFRYLG